MRKLGMLVTIGILLSVASSAVQACYSGLLLIPTADVLDKGEYGIEAQIDGSLSDLSSDTQILNTEFGFMNRLEAGFDFDLSKNADSTLLLNAKYLLLNENKQHPAIAVGTCNIGENQKHSPYLVLTHSFDGLRGHLGTMRIDDRNRVFIGVDKPVNDKLTIMADYTNGSENAASLGASYQINNSFGILAGVIFPNSSSDGIGFSLHLCLCGDFNKPKEKK